MTRAIALTLAILGASRAFACAPAPHAGDRINIAEESAVIVWDPVTKTEHFIRRATFQGSARDFGFLVPTPSVPTLTAVDDGIFELLQAKTARKIVEQTTKKIDWTPFVLMFFVANKGEMATTAAGPVEVLSTTKVAGYEAVVLDVSDASALGTWLTQHEYAATPDLEAWVAPYVRDGWKITAFKIDKSQPEMAAQTSAVKMSFATERPFFPYREPATPIDLSVRSLRVFYAGPERTRGTIGASGFWPGVLTWSDTLDAETLGRLAELSRVALPAGTRLTSFIDTSVTRPGMEDLFFVRDVHQNAYIPPPWVRENVDTTHIPLDLAAVPLVVIGFLIRRSRHSSRNR